jgi:glyoxylase-like metal-dependent hydrolase (beta-lactamase superfamily II)
MSAATVQIVNVGYHSANYYMLGQGRGRLLIDVGMPGSLGILLANLRRKGIALDEIGYLLATHYHPDHAGIAQELKARGVRLVVLETQRSALIKLRNYVKISDGFVPIASHDNLQLALDESTAFLAGIGLAGSIIATPGHSDDSVTLVLAGGEAFTGDLPPPFVVDTDTAQLVGDSWARIRALGATMVYPGHGPPRPIAAMMPS